jgi:hypothetical protein
MSWQAAGRTAASRRLHTLTLAPRLVIRLPECGTGVVVFEDGAVVVKQSRLRLGHHVEVVGGAGVLEVVHDSRHQRGENLQVRQPVLRI